MTATTDMYTLGHTHSLHDAPPICEQFERPLLGDRRRHGAIVGAQRFHDLEPDRVHRVQCRHRLLEDGRDLVAAERPQRRVVDARSEEHTPELQSLMRISYAVFCLKKTKLQK